MNLCFIVDNPETTTHPVIGAALRQLGLTHAVRLLDVLHLTAEEAIAQERSRPLADMYLLKSHTFQALDLAHDLEQRGAWVVNSWVSSLACQDRVLMAHLLEEANLPCPATRTYHRAGKIAMAFPLIAKSRYSRRGDHVGRVDGAEQLQTLVQEWDHEPFVLQEYTPGDGADIKLWVLGKQVFAARRCTALPGQLRGSDVPIPPAALPETWKRIALETGRAFGLQLYGVDLLSTNRGPVVVDVNAFPGFRGVAGAGPALIELIERLARGPRNRYS